MSPLEFPPVRCPRGRGDCRSTGQVVADGGSTFMCCGERQGAPETWSVPADRFTLCWKSEDGVDVLMWADRYDLHSHLLAVSRALVMDDLASRPEPEEENDGE